MWYKANKFLCLVLKRLDGNLNEKFIDNKLFWKTLKLLQSDKAVGIDKIHLIENNELFKTHLETFEILNNFFPNIVQNLDISRY